MILVGVKRYTAQASIFDVLIGIKCEKQFKLQDPFR